jgi:hypothetical protein
MIIAGKMIGNCDVSGIGSSSHPLNRARAAVIFGPGFEELKRNVPAGKE